MTPSLLPGLRDLRVPLAVGFAWGAFAWLLLVDFLPTPTQASGKLKLLYELFAYFGPVVTLGVLTFLAYLLGVLTLIKPHSFFSAVFWASGRVLDLYRLPFVRQIIDREIGDIRELRELGFSVFDARRVIEDLMAATLDRLRENHVPAARILDYLPRTHRKFAESVAEAGLRAGTSEDGVFWDWVETEPGRKFVAHDVADDFPRVASRLLVREKELFDKFDRDSTESEFRLGLMLPISAIAFVLVFQADWFAQGWDLLFALVSAYVFLGAFLIRGLSKQKEATGVLLDALAEGLVAAPTVEALEALSDEFEAASKLSWPWKRRKGKTTRDAN